jgi:para-nitrobenzyl esterase
MGKKRIYSGAAQKDSKPVISSRRALLGSMATLGAGIAGSMIAPQKLHAVSASAQPAAPESSAVPCGRTKVVSSDAATVVETSSGKIRGYERKGIYIFKGVPYGASTAGRGRFMPPAKPEPWTGIRNALEYGRVCPQQDSAHFNMDGKNRAGDDEYKFLIHRGTAIVIPGEDCLRVNLWTRESARSWSGCMEVDSAMDAVRICSPSTAKTWRATTMWSS